MSTRFYLPAGAEATPISPTPDPAWGDQSILARAMCKTSKRSLAMTTVPFTDANSTPKYILFRQYVSEELVAGQSIAAEQTIWAQCRVKEENAANNMFLTFGVRVIAGDGTPRFTVIPVICAGAEVDSGGLVNRSWSYPQGVNSYDTVAGDRLVIEVGMGGPF